MNELQAMAIAALEDLKNEEGAELAFLHPAVLRLKATGTPEQLAQAEATFAQAEARHARIAEAIDWVKAAMTLHEATQPSRMTDFKASEIRHRGYRDIGVVLQDELGSTAVVANGAVRWINSAQELFAFMHPSENTVLVDGTTTITSFDKTIAKSVTFKPAQTVKYDSEAAKAIIKNAILSNSHPAPDWHLAFNCADEIDIVANQIATKFAELANQQTVSPWIKRYSAEDKSVNSAMKVIEAKLRNGEIIRLDQDGTMYDGWVQCGKPTDIMEYRIIGNVVPATPCGQVTTTQTGKHTCTTMRVGDEKICPDCNPKRNFLEWLGEQQTESKQLSRQDILKVFYTLKDKDKYFPMIEREISSALGSQLFVYGWQKSVEFDIQPPAPEVCSDGGKCGAGGYCITCTNVPAPDGGNK